MMRQVDNALDLYAIDLSVLFVSNSYDYLTLCLSKYSCGIIQVICSKSRSFIIILAQIVEKTLDGKWNSLSFPLLSLYMRTIKGK